MPYIKKCFLMQYDGLIGITLKIFQVVGYFSTSILVKSLKYVDEVGKVMFYIN